MKPVCFSPGPSELYPKVRTYMLDAFDEGILSISHRSKQFDSISAETCRLFAEKLLLPAEYTLLFTTSATESWEIIHQSLGKGNSAHFYSGSFGEKWAQYAQHINAMQPKGYTLQHPFDIEKELNEHSVAHLKEIDLACFTMNETSNTTKLSNAFVDNLREAIPNKNCLIAMDATSILGGEHLPWEKADIWFASVQKCLGLPAGLGLLIVNTKAIERAKEVNENSHYNSLLTLLKHREKFQTTCTPNVLGIYLLNRVLEDISSIENIHQRVLQQAEEWYSFLDAHTLLKPLVNKSSVRSNTVIGVKVEDEEKLNAIKKAALEQGFLLGSGYGKWKTSSFRIANFPALTATHHQELRAFLASL